MKQIQQIGLLMMVSALVAGSAVAEDMTSPLEIQNLKMVQDRQTRDVKVTYDLINGDAPALIRFDVVTNVAPDSTEVASIGSENVVSVSGAVSADLDSLIPAGRGKEIIWHARRDWPGFLLTNVHARIIAYSTNDFAQVPGMYLMVDLSGGPEATNFPVTYTMDAPVFSLADPSCCSNQLWLKRIEPGSYVMGSPADETYHKDNELQHAVNIKTPFFAGVFPVTQEQYRRVMGVLPDAVKDPADWAGGNAPIAPVNMVTYEGIRGSTNAQGVYAYRWPANSHAVSAQSFMGVLRAKTGLPDFDLPTDAQWEYACRAGTTNALFNGMSVSTNNAENQLTLAPIAWWTGDDAWSIRYVGQKAPNAWGLYEMIGSVWEICLDWYSDHPAGGDDPAGAPAGNKRVRRGGGYDSATDGCRSASRLEWGATDTNQGVGFRVFMNAY